MSIYIILGVCAVVFFAAIAVFGATGGFNGAMGDDQAHDRPRGLPEGWTADDVGQVRFQLAARGYRTDAVDRVLEQMTARLREQDAEITRLQTERDTLSTPSRRLGDGYPTDAHAQPDAGELSDAQPGDPQH